MLLRTLVGRPLGDITRVMLKLADRNVNVVIPNINRRDEIGDIAASVGVFRDSIIRADQLSAEHEAMKVADALAQQHRAHQIFLDTVLEHVPAAIFVKDAQDRSYLHVNRATEALLGLPRERLIGMTSASMLSAEAASAMHERETEALKIGKIVEEGVVFQTSGQGKRVAVVTRVAIPGPDGQPRYLLNMIEDVTDRQEAEQRIAYMAHFDTLTDLPNRVMFAERLNQAMAAARHEGKQVAVLGLDLDHFKEVNDTLGHAAGDALLHAAATRMRQCLRDGDTLARLGGDEFAVVQCRLRLPSDAEALAERLLKAIAQPFDIEGQRAFVSLSIGIAFSTPGLQPDELVKQADLALYDAKAAGRNCFRRYLPAMEERLQQRRVLDTDLRAALGTDQLRLHYQPQVDLDTLEVVGAEALMRWTRPGHGEISPSAFIPLAEETGLIGPIGEWLLHEACVEAMHWPAHLSIAVNVSPIQLRMPGFVDTVRQALNASGLDPFRLELEVTEGVLLRETEGVLATFAELRALGVSLAIDDFGTGYSSLSCLQKFRFDKLKIDRSFIKGLNVASSASAIVRAMLGLSEALGMVTIAEGIETEAELAALRALGGHKAQGYYFWRPLDARAMRAVASAPRSAAVATRSAVCL